MPTPSPATPTPRVVAATACFTVTLPPDATVVNLTATVFRLEGDAWPQTAVLLVPGGGSSRAIWDGGSIGYGRLNDTSTSRMLAASGVAAFTLERPGFPDSPVTGPTQNGATLGWRAQSAAIDQVLSSLQQGAYSTVGGKCGSTAGAKGFPFPRLVLGAHSVGGGYAIAAGGTFKGPLKGLFTYGTSLQGVSAEMGAAIAACAAQRPVFSPPGYVHGFCDDPASGAIPRCQDLFMVRARTEPLVGAAMCKDLSDAIDPAGELDLGELVPERSLLRKALPTIPVLDVLGSEDRVVLNGPRPDGSSWYGVEEGEWKTDCACRGQFQMKVVPGVGHNFMAQVEYQFVNALFVSWLEANGLAG